MYKQSGSDKDSTENELIPVSIDDTSTVEFITKKQLSEIVIEECTERYQQFSEMEDEQKEQILSNAIIDLSKSITSENREVVECTLNYGIYKLLTFFYIPDSIAATIASWIAWFIRGTASISWLFLKKTVLFMLTHYHITILLLFTNFVILARVVSPILIEALNNRALIRSDNIAEFSAFLKPFIIAENYDGGAVVDILRTTKTYLTWFLYLQLGIAGIQLIWQIYNSLSEINANCVLTGIESIQHPITKQQIKDQLDNAFDNIKQTSAIKKSIKQSKSLKNKSPEQFQREFVNHIENSIARTPINQITRAPTLTPSSTNTQPSLTQIEFGQAPQNVTPEQYMSSIVLSSIKLRNDDIDDINNGNINNNLSNKFSIKIEPSNYIDSGDVNVNVNSNLIDSVSRKISDNLSIVLGSL